MKLLMKLFSEEEGVTLIEYALIAFLIVIGIFLTIASIGLSVRDFYQLVADGFP